jgi:hypothetical protein
LADNYGMDADQTRKCTHVIVVNWRTVTVRTAVPVTLVQARGLAARALMDRAALEAGQAMRLDGDYPGPDWTAIGPASR